MSKKSNNALNKENKNESISISPRNVSDDCIPEKNNSLIQPALKSNSKKINNFVSKIHFQILDTNNDSSIPAATDLSKTYKTRELSVALEQSDVINKMVTTSLVMNYNILSTVNNRKRKETPNTDLKRNPKNKKGMLIDKDHSLQPAKIEKKSVIDQIKDLKIILVNLETPVKAKKIKEDHQKTSTSSIEEIGKVSNKNILRISPKPKKVKNNKSPQSMKTVSVALKQSDVINKMVANTSLVTNYNILSTVNNKKRKGTPNTDLKHNPKNKKGMLIDKDQSLQPAELEKKGVFDQIKDFKIILGNLETPAKAKKIKEDNQKTSTSSIEENGKVTNKNILRMSAKPKKVKNNKSPQSMKTNSVEIHEITGQIKNVETSLKPKKKKGGLVPKNAKSIEKHGKIKDVEISPELKKTKKEKGGLDPNNASSIQKHGVTGKIKDVEMLPEPKEQKKENGKSLQSMNTTSIDIAGQINDSLNLKQRKSNAENLTMDLLKNSIILQKTRLREMHGKKRLEKKRIEKKGIEGQIQDLVNLEKLVNSISDEKKFLKFLQRRLISLTKKEHTSRDYIIKPDYYVEGRLNLYVKKKLQYGGETIIDINRCIGLLANISAWSEFLADLPEEDRVMFFEPPSLLVSLLSECEPLLPLRRVVKDLGLLLQNEQEKKELEQELMSPQIPSAILEDNGLSLPPTDVSNTKVDPAPVPMVKLVEVGDSEEGDSEEGEQEKKKKKPRRKKQNGFRKTTNYDIESDSSWIYASSDDDYDEYDDKANIIIIKQDLKIDDIMNLKNKESVTNDASCIRSDNYFTKPVGKFLIGIGSGLAHEYFQRDMLREQKHRLREQKKLQKPCHLLEKSILFLGENLQISAKANLGFKFKQKNCRFCNYQSESMHVMALHMNSPHNITDDKFKCNYCDIEVNNSSVILDHMESVHGITGYLDAPLPEMPCPLCPFDLKIGHSLHPKLCIQKFDIHQNLIPGWWDLPAKIMPMKTFKCPDEVVDDFRKLLLLKSSMKTGSADGANEATIKNLKVAPAVAAGVSITNTDLGLVTPVCGNKGLPQTEKIDIAEVVVIEDDP